MQCRFPKIYITSGWVSSHFKHHSTVWLVEVGKQLKLKCRIADPTLCNVHAADVAHNTIIFCLELPRYEVNLSIYTKRI